MERRGRRGSKRAMSDAHMITPEKGVHDSCSIEKNPGRKGP
jgi:hypothetical protein